MMKSDDAVPAPPTRGALLMRRSLATGLAMLLLATAGCSSFGGAFAPNAAVVTDASATGSTANTADSDRIVASYGGVYHDDKVEQTIAAIVSNIVTASGRPDINYQITILDASAINAFALPDGHLYVTRGLLALASDSSEVAAVLAHEMGHVTANHAAQREQEAKNVLVSQEAVSKATNDAQSQQLALAASERTLAAYSRQQELEADSIGIKTIGDAGYDPYAAARFLNAMQKFSDFRSAATVKDPQPPDFLATHPSTPERVAAATQEAGAFGAPGVGDSGRDRYLDGIDGMIYGDDPAKGFIRDRNFLDPNLAVGFTVPTGFVLDNSSEAVLATGNDGTALRFDAITPATTTDVASYLRSGWVNGLDSSSVSTFTVGGFAAASARAQAKGWHFQIVVLQSASGAIYRFIFANSADSAAFRTTATQTVSTFRSLTPAEMASLKPLRVHVVTAAKGDTEASLAKRMHGVDRARDLFDVMNDVAPGAPIPPGTRVKIVTDS